MSSSQLRSPEFSHPLTTALQIAIFEVLKSWGTPCSSVVGHSSGEIAAAFAAGRLTCEEAIKVAYYRGQAALHIKSETSVGMLAVGLGPVAVKAYINRTPTVQIACENSSENVTLSGALDELELLCKALQADKHFARLLLVDLAYHSDFMKDIAAKYKKLLEENTSQYSTSPNDITMFSSITGKLLDTHCDSEYWRDNMVSPVLFNQATQAMLSHSNSPDILIEIGPSGALAGPLKQIQRLLDKSRLPSKYFATLTRGKNSADAMFDFAGRLFILGAPISMAKVNDDGMTVPLATIVDLPNYSWNHSTKYWHEGQASKDWRFRRFVHHDLLGSKILGSPWVAPSFNKNLKVQDLPWLNDHKVRIIHSAVFVKHRP